MATIRGRLGRRGAMLLTLGVTYVLLGIGQVLEPLTFRSGVLHTYLPDAINAGIWIVSGGIAGIAAFRNSDSWGWAALYIAPALRITSYLVGIGYWLAPGGIEGYAAGWYAALVYMPFVFVTLICSGWREPMSMPMPVSQPEPGRSS